MIRLTTNHGVIELSLDAAKAPVTVKNFIDYAKAGFYDGTIFHRVINGFMIQGGGMEPGMKTKETRAPIKNEADNGLKNERGSIAMARTNEPHSASSQFFINVVDNPFLDYRSSTPDGWGYCVFGKVTNGLDVIDAIRKVGTTTKSGHQNVPRDDVILEKVEVIDE